MLGGKLMDKNVMISIVLGILVLIAAVQAVQLFSLKGSVQTGAVATSTQPVAAASSGAAPSAGALPSNLQNLPTMVGGC
jgi:hypothetical protein